MRDLATVLIFTAAAVVIVWGAFIGATGRGPGTRQLGFSRAQIRTRGIGTLALGIAIMPAAFQLVGVFSWALLFGEVGLALLGGTLMLFARQIGQGSLR